MRLVPFRKEHLPDADPAWLDVAVSCGPSLTGVRGDEILFCMGLTVVKQGVAEAWIVVPDRDKVKDLASARFIVKSASYWIRFSMKDLGLRRVAAWVRCDIPSHVKWVEMLGFMREGIMHRFDRDGGDCYLYAMIREDA